mgnify:CR=1 FL=1
MDESGAGGGRHGEAMISTTAAVRGHGIDALDRLPPLPLAEQFHEAPTAAAAAAASFVGGLSERGEEYEGRGVGWR